MAVRQQAPVSTTPTDNIEFIVKAQENLLLAGNERTITRVKKGNLYSCLMLKTQRFSSLFRHYAKHHGLKRDDLVYTFTDDISGDDTPESIYLQKNDIITVRAKVDDAPSVQAPEADSDLTNDLRKLLNDEMFCDVEFKVGPDEETVRAHRAVLTCRSDFFAAMFRQGPGSMRESVGGMVRLPGHSAAAVRRMLEFIYTGLAPCLDECAVDEIVEMLRLSEEYLLPALKKQCEVAVGSMLDVQHVGRLLIASEQHHAPVLRHMCLEFVLDNMEEVRNSPSFSDDLEQYPSLAILMMEACAPIVSQNRKKRRRLDADSPVTVSSAAVPAGDTTGAADNNGFGNTAAATTAGDGAGVGAGGGAAPRGRPRGGGSLAQQQRRGRSSSSTGGAGAQ